MPNSQAPIACTTEEELKLTERLSIINGGEIIVTISSSPTIAEQGPLSSKEQSRAEQQRAEQGRAKYEQSRAEQEAMS